MWGQQDAENLPSVTSLSLYLSNGRTWDQGYACLRDFNASSSLGSFYMICNGSLSGTAFVTLVRPVAGTYKQLYVQEVQVLRYGRTRMWTHARVIRCMGACDRDMYGCIHGVTAWRMTGRASLWLGANITIA